MHLEVVDKRSPGLIRVATVEEVDTHRIKVGVCVWCLQNITFCDVIFEIRCCCTLYSVNTDCSLVLLAQLAL